MKFQKFQWRLFIPTLVIFIIGLIILNKTVADQVSQTIQQTLESEIRSSLPLISKLIEQINFNNTDQDSLISIINQFGNWEEVEILILSSSGEITASSSNTSGSIQTFRSEIQEAISTGIGVSVDENLDEQLHIFHAASQINIDDSNAEFVYLILKTNRLFEARNMIGRYIWGIGGILLISISVPLLYLGLRGNRSLDEIANAADLLSQGTLDIEVQSGPNDEFRKATHAINNLANQLKIQFTSVQEEQAQFNAVLTQLNDGVIILDQEGFIRLANNSARDLFNLKTGEIIGERINRVISYHQIVELWQIFQTSQQEQSSLIELSDLGKMILATITPLENSPQKNSLLIVQDLTQLRQLETVRRDFISNISHELRTPLASLKALAETLQISALDDPQAAKRFLSKMETEIDSLAQLVSELLELSRIESGQVPLELTTTDAWHIFSNAVDRMKILAENGNITLKAENQAGQVDILADSPRLTQVLVNIIHNAIKFTPENGEIDCILMLQDDNIQFSIKDTGSGIAREDLPRIFERFYKSRRTKKGTGTGLGLSIAKHLVGAHGGKIWAESHLGEGSTFIISLPKFN